MVDLLFFYYEILNIPQLIALLTAPAIVVGLVVFELMTVFNFLCKRIFGVIVPLPIIVALLFAMSCVYWFRILS